MTDNNHASFQTSKRQVQTYIPSADEMSIREIDWKRVYRKVRGIPRQTTIYQHISSVSWGVAGSSALALIPLYQSITGIESWVKPTFWIIIAASLIVGFIANRFTKERDGYIESSSCEVMKDMEEIYKTFFPEKNLDKSC